MNKLGAVFDNATPRRRGCRICTEQNVATVMVRIQELGPTGSLVKGNRTTSRMFSFCDVHAVEVWERVLAALETKP